MRTVKQVLKPDWRKLLLFAIFIAIAIGGKIQAWAFSDVPPKPPLYDLLRPFPIWPIWMFLLMPLALLALPLGLLGLDVMGGPSWLFIVANITYFYLLSCLMVAGSRWIKARQPEEVTMERDALTRRYRYLWTFEAAAILVFVVLFLYHALPDGHWSNWIARTYSLAVVIIILLQGVVWWRWKLRTLQAGQRTMPLRILIRFRRFKWVNWLLIGLFSVVLWLKWWLTDSFWLSNDTWLGLLFMGGAFLEQINYYYYQLMYDNRYDWTWLRTHRRLRQGSIGKALAQMSE